jgi:hypothetical protein
MTPRQTFLRLAAVLAAIPLVAAAFSSDAEAAVSQPRDVSGFDQIRLQGAFTATITAGSRTTSVVITGDPAVVNNVTTGLDGKTLVVGMKPGTNFLKNTPGLTIALPALTGFANEGAGSMKIVGLTGGTVALSNAGAATITASGRAANLTIALDGTGKIDTTGVNARDVTVDNNGVGSVRVRASGNLTMNVNGVGEIRYAGNPTNVESHVNGVGRISRL